MINWSRARTLAAEFGAADFEELVALFIEEVEEVMARLPGQADPALLARDLHFLKGSALNLGFAAFSDACRDGEALLASSTPRPVDLAALGACFDRSKEHFLAALPGQLGAQTSL